MEHLHNLYTTFLETEHFPGWEIYIFLNTCFWISVTIRLNSLREDISELNNKPVERFERSWDEDRDDEDEVLSPCCGALVIHHNICSDCKEHF